MKRALKTRHHKDAQAAEFNRRDLGHDIARSRSAVVIHPRTRRMPTSILLEPAIIRKLKEKAERRGIGYQTMLKMVVYEHIDDYR
ncbi:MAG: hypothetical protein KGL04_06020 [Elusimicrobia bacterium]|nr:hypothetical protein [Elusimicrobiota bacterium]